MLYRSLVWLGFGLSAVTGLASAEQRVDPRAFEMCAARDSSFVKINDCLPDMHVAVITLDAVGKVYGPDAEVLIKRCRELNDDEIGASTCALEAIDDAVELQSRLPEGAVLDDELFLLLADKAKLEQVEAAAKTARGAFPDKMFWGGSMYHPYSK
ncbi:hypothetical protein [Martelella sp. AMO21009]